MTERKQALQELRDKVAAGKWDCKFPPRGMYGLGSAKRVHNAAKAYNGSLDAAKELHEAVLPEREWSIDECGDAAVGDGSGDWICTANTYPARAWLLCILDALIAREGD